jgi:hypothetical protein
VKDGCAARLFSIPEQSVCDWVVFLWTPSAYSSTHRWAEPARRLTEPGSGMVFDPAFWDAFYPRICIMNKTARFLSIAAVTAFTAFGAHADEADGSQFALKFETNRTRAEVQAEAATVAQTRSQEPAGSRVVTYTSTADRAAVRAQAAEALRLGQIPHGEFSAM